jgi:hypothetical protein
MEESRLAAEEKKVLKKKTCTFGTFGTARRLKKQIPGDRAEEIRAELLFVFIRLGAIGSCLLFPLGDFVYA